MIKVRNGMNYNYYVKVASKEELKEILKKYRGILNNDIIDYLNSLIELEFSVIRRNINEIDRKTLSELEIYKEVAIYNIYNRVKNLIKNQEDYIEVSDNNTGYEGLTIKSLKYPGPTLFDFNYSYLNKTKDIGIITLFQILEKNNIEDKLNIVMSELEHLYNEENPYDTREGYVGGKSVTWDMEHSKKIQKYEKLFEELDSKKVERLSDKDKEEIEITRKIHTLLMDDFGLKREDFIDETSIHFENIDSKHLVKRMPNLIINDYINYR